MLSLHCRGKQQLTISAITFGAYTRVSVGSNVGLQLSVALNVYELEPSTLTPWLPVCGNFHEKRFPSFFRHETSNMCNDKKWSLRWPDTIYLREGQLFCNQFFSCSTAFDCWDILDTEKGMLEVYQKRVFIEIDTNMRKFSAIFLNVVFKDIAYYRQNKKTLFLHITLNRCWNLKDFRDQVLDKSAPQNLYNKWWLK